jgi:hypothetical protein
MTIKKTRRNSRLFTFTTLKSASRAVKSAIVSGKCVDWRSTRRALAACFRRLFELSWSDAKRRAENLLRNVCTNLHFLSGGTFMLNKEQAVQFVAKFRHEEVRTRYTSLLRRSQAPSPSDFVDGNYAT